MTALIFILLTAFTSQAMQQNEACVVGLQREAFRQDLRKLFTLQYVDSVYTTPEQNGAYMDSTLHPEDRSRIHFTVENSWLKPLNDKILKNKDDATAVTNFHHASFLEELAAHEPHFASPQSPAWQTLYSDFKSVADSIPVDPGTNGHAQVAHLFQTFQSCERRYYTNPVISTITRKSDNFFQMGAGFTEGEANLAARYARNHGSTNSAFFEGPEVHAYFTQILTQVKGLHRQILGLPRPLLEIHGGVRNLSLEVFAYARKSETAAELNQKIAHAYPGAAPVGDIILNYTQLSNEFSPRQLIRKREPLTVHYAPFGVISLDFLNLGAENLRATNEALLAARDVREAVQLARLGEQGVTRIFEERKELVRQKINRFFNGQVEIRFSGDDGIVIPLVPYVLGDLVMLLADLKALYDVPFFRMAAISAAGAASHSSELITHNESIEKAFRAQMAIGSASALLRDIEVGAYTPDEGPYRKVFLVLALKRKLNPVQKAAVITAFGEATAVVEAAVQAQGHEISYDPFDIYVNLK